MLVTHNVGIVRSFELVENSKWKSNVYCVFILSEIIVFFRQNRYWGCDVVLFQHNKLITVQQNKLMVYCGRIYNSNTLSLNFRRGISLFCFYYALKIVHNRNKTELLRWIEDISVPSTKRKYAVSVLRTKQKRLLSLTC